MDEVNFFGLFSPLVMPHLHLNNFTALLGHLLSHHSGCCRDLLMLTAQWVLAQMSFGICLARSRFPFSRAEHFVEGN